MSAESLIIEKIPIKVRRNYCRVLFWKVELQWQSVNISACLNVGVAEVIKHCYNFFVVEIVITDCHVPVSKLELVFFYNAFEGLLATRVQLEFKIVSENFFSI